MSRPEVKPWHQVVKLRDELRTGELSLSIFAADLYDVVMGKARPIYQEPEQFFSFTFPTFNLRELAKDVMLRLAGRNDKAIRQLELTYGGGKTHTLITLYHLTNDPRRLPDLPTIHEFTQNIGQLPPQARIAVLAFDKLDVEKGMEITSSTGEKRWLKHPWSVMAFQLAGSDGLRLLHPEGKDDERESAPAENLLVELLSLPVKQGLAPLILIDEVLMYVRGKVGLQPEWRSRLIDFFQYLTQAATKIGTCAIVASLLATDPLKNDPLGKELTRDLNAIFRREREEVITPVLKEEVAEVLRRRFFKPESVQDQRAFRAAILPAVQGIADLDEQTQKNKKDVEERFLKSYPFHPDLTEVLYGKWSQLESFQRARGILRTFALALRDAEKWDKSPLIATNVFLGEPNRPTISESARELTNVAETEEYEGKRQEWTSILEGELARAREIQAEISSLHFREVEQAVFATFLHSQPVGQKAQLRDLLILLGHTRPDKIALDKALRRWTEISWFLDEEAMQDAETSPSGGKLLPRSWRLGSRPNLRQMHHEARIRVSSEVIEAKLLKAIENTKSLTAGASAAGAKPHMLPEKPRDIDDDGEFHYAVLGPKAASRATKPSDEARRFINEKTGPDAPRVYRNAIVLAVPSLEGIEAARNAIRDHEGWLEVESQLKGQDIDNNRRQILDIEKKKAEKLVTDLVKQAYTIVVTVSDKNEVQALKVVLKDDTIPLFNLIKAEQAARIKEAAVTAETFLPGGPYDFWRERETEHPVSDLTSAFANRASLPKMLNRRAIFETLLAACQQGLFVLRSNRNDGSFKTFWRDAPSLDMLTSKDFKFSVVLPEAATLSSIPAHLLSPGTLLELWNGPELTVQNVYDYFSGRTLRIKYEGYEETVVIPKAERNVVDAAIQAAVKEKRLWFLASGASFLGEDIPADLLTADAILQAPPQAIPGKEVLPENLPEAWGNREETTALAISNALSTKAGKALPWLIVRDALTTALNSRWLERTVDSGPWPCDYVGASAVKASMRKEKTSPAGPASVPSSYTPTPSSRPDRLVAEANLSVYELQELNEQISALKRACTDAGLDPTFHLRIELHTSSQPAQEAVERINQILQEISGQLKLQVS